VSISDFQKLKANYAPTGYSVSPDSEASVAEALSSANVGSGDLELRIDINTGEVVLAGNDATFDSIEILGSDESVLESNFLGVEGLDGLTGDDYISGVTLNEVNLDGTDPVGQVYNAALDARDWSFEYGGGGQTFDGTIEYVPEPSALALLSVGGLLTLGRRRRREAR
jgi:hypothetical protein